jgi:hypothetical protein
MTHTRTILLCINFLLGRQAGAQTKLKVTIDGWMGAPLELLLSALARWFPPQEGNKSNI